MHDECAHIIQLLSNVTMESGSPLVTATVQTGNAKIDAVPAVVLPRVLRCLPSSPIFVVRDIAG